MKQKTRQPIYEFNVLGVDYFFFVESPEEAKELGQKIKGLKINLCFPRGGQYYAESQSIEELREQMIVAIGKAVNRSIFLDLD